jgi:hypothetical protein
VAASNIHTPLVSASLKLVSPKCRFFGPIQALPLAVGTFKACVCQFLAGSNFAANQLKDLWLFTMSELAGSFFKSALQRLPGNHFLSAVSVSSLLGIDLQRKFLIAKA